MSHFTADQRPENIDAVYQRIDQYAAASNFALGEPGLPGPFKPESEAVVDLDYPAQFAAGDHLPRLDDRLVKAMAKGELQHALAVRHGLDDCLSFGNCSRWRLFAQHRE